MPDFKQTDLTYLKQISDKRAALFAKLGVRNLEDLIFFFPRSYEDMSQLKPLYQVVEGETVTVKGRLVDQPKLQRRGRLSWLRGNLTDGVSILPVVWFNQPWLASKLQVDQDYYFYGKVQAQGRRLSLLTPTILSQEDFEANPIRAIYPLTAGLNQSLVRQAVKQCLDLYDHYLIDPLPDKVRQEAELCSLDYAISKIHLPETAYEHEMARERLAFEELFLVRAALYLLKRKRQVMAKAPALKVEGTGVKEKLNRLREGLAFELTKAQVNAINDLLHDLRQERPMNRLLQGDVGSGKTIVSAFAMAYTAWCGGQAILMAPTSILAEQHYHSMKKLFAETDLSLALLTGQTGQKERREILIKAREGELDLLIGTHAVLEKDLEMPKLALTITDEQHRFGVSQRRSLAKQGERGLMPHRLVMSATPIPRTLGLIIYGDLDLSLMRELPRGRKVIKTYRAKSRDLPQIYDLMRRTVKRGEQVYVVCPLIEDSDKSQLESAETTYQKLAQKVFPDLRVGLIHGSLKADQKSKVMTEFLKGNIDILVSTTVIEVGVDNPRASLMVIKNAERFGLAQLHQLRGRIGRSDLESVCLLVSDSDDELAQKRLTSLCRTGDGFALAEQDLELRGPGDFFGTKQHGLPQFRLINLYQDQAMIDRVNRVFQKILDEDPDLKEKDQQNIVRAIKQRYPELLEGLTL